MGIHKEEHPNISSGRMSYKEWEKSSHKERRFKVYMIYLNYIIITAE